MNDDFYIGYVRQTSPGIASFIHPRVVILLVVAVGIAMLLVSSQAPFADAKFEFGTTRSFEGIVQEAPYPTLLVSRPGQNTLGHAVSRYYLVAPGKRGAQDAVAGLDGRRVSLDGTLVYRDDQTMIEVKPESITPTSAVVATSTAAEPLGSFTLVGEIVDSKCYLGVMKPGHLKPHRACAVRCISGGIPPVFLVRTEDGSATYLLLVGADGRAVNAEVLDRVAEILEITGAVERLDDLLVLKAEPSTFRWLETEED